MPTSRRLLHVLGAIMVLSACEPREANEPHFLVRDSSGVEWARSLSPLDQSLLVDPTPRFSIDGDFAEPDYVLFGVRYASHLSDGGFVIGNRGTRELFFFSAAGEFEGVFGRQGDGPGEFQRLFDLYRCGDDHLVIEELTGLTVIDGVARAFDRNIQIVGHLAQTRGNISGVDGACSAALMVDPGPPPLQTRGEVFDLRATLYWADFATADRDTIATFGATQAYGWELDGRATPVRLPYGRVASWAVHPEGVVLGLADPPSFQFLNRAGEVTRLVEWSTASDALTDQEWAHFEESVAELRRDHPDESRFQPSPDDLPRPERKPFYSEILVDDVGRVWVQSYGSYGVGGPEPSTTWSVFTAKGEWLAEVEMPHGLEVLSIGPSSVIGVSRDSFDVERVQVHDFELPLPS
jgi:hypothetical protein